MKVIFKNKIDTSIFDKGFYLGILEEKIIKELEEIIDLKVKEKLIKPWRFDRARNESLKLVPKDADICVCTDLDELFEPGWRKILEEKWTPETNQGIYKFWFNAKFPDQVPNYFDNAKIHDRNSFVWKWIIHEFIVPKNPEQEIKQVKLNASGDYWLIEERVPKTDWAHPNSGELLIQAKQGSWCAYPWWTLPQEAPDYATHIDIHSKPGYDPCELFFERWAFPPKTCQDLTRIKGTHGHKCEVAYLSTLPQIAGATFIELAEAIATWCRSLPPKGK